MAVHGGEAWPGFRDGTILLFVEEANIKLHLPGSVASK